MVFSGAAAVGKPPLKIILQGRLLQHSLKMYFSRTAVAMQPPLKMYF
jgi:hypothetical protein